MKIAATIVRILMGLLFLVSVLNFFFPFMPAPPMGDGAKTFIIGLSASGYLMPLVKIVELLCAIAFITGRFVPLAAVVIFPITLNIVLFHATLAPQNMGIQIFLLLGNLFLAYYYRKNYESLLAFK